MVGVLAQAVLGGIVVYTKLNPYVVMVHFFATMLLLVDAVVLVHRSTRDYAPGSAHLLVPRPLIRLYYGLLALLALVIAAGTATTGAGPHAGDASGQQVAKRLPVALRDMAELHSSLALLLIGVTIGFVVAVHVGDVPERVRRSARILLVVFVAQAAVGYTQYFTHLPALLVEVHIIGATALVIGAVQTFLVCTYHAPEAVPAPSSPTRPRPGCPSAPIRLSSVRAGGTSPPPSSSGLGHRPFTAAARVQIPLGVLSDLDPDRSTPHPEDVDGARRVVDRAGGADSNTETLGWAADPIELVHSRHRLHRGRVLPADWDDGTLARRRLANGETPVRTCAGQVVQRARCLPRAA